MLKKSIDVSINFSLVSLDSFLKSISSLIRKTLWCYDGGYMKNVFLSIHINIILIYPNFHDFYFLINVTLKDSKFFQRYCNKTVYVCPSISLFSISIMYVALMHGGNTIHSKLKVLISENKDSHTV